MSSKKGNNNKKTNSYGGINALSDNKEIVIKKKGLKGILIGLVAFVCVLAIVVGVVFGIKSQVPGGGNTDDNGTIDEPINPDDTNPPQDQEIPNNPSLDEETPVVEPPKPYKNTTTGYYTANETKAEEITSYVTSVTKASQTAEYLNVNVPREVPTEVKNFSAETGVTKQPMYAQSATRPRTYGELLAQREEARMLNASFSAAVNKNYSASIYDELDEEGYLIRNGEKVDDGNGGYKKIFKHSAANGLYMGNVADNEPAISKKLTFASRSGMASNQITGIYAPAGEVLKIEMSQADLDETGGLVVCIGQVYNNGNVVGVEFNWGNPAEANNKDHADDVPISIKGGGYRIDYICNFYKITKPVAYVGSYIGGPVYVRPVNNGVSRKFSVTISGGVRYQHFILGVTTPEEYALNAKSSAPYFDLEIYDNGIRFSAPNIYVKNKTFEDCLKAAVLWEKIILTSTRVQGAVTNSNVPVVAIFDCYIAAGAAFANPGRNGIVCPIGWMTGALDYESFVRGGAWGVMHEYNHCWQSYGVPGGDEVVNNGVTLVEYLLYTKISTARKLNESIGGWNRLTDPAWALAECLKIAATNGKAKTCGISFYASLLYNIGAENYINVARGGRNARAKVYYGKLTEATHQDFSYFFSDILHLGIVPDTEEATSTDSQLIPQSLVDGARAKNYPMFVPVSSIYAVGRTIMYDGKPQYIKVAQPFEYTGDSPAGEYTMDFGNRNSFVGTYSLKNTGLVIPDGFTVTVKSITQPKNGTVKMLEDNKIKYIPTTNDIYSGEFNVTIGITKNDNAFKVDDVTFTVNLKRNTNALTRTTYVYPTANDATAKYNSLITEEGTLDFGITETDHIFNVNPVQNSNTDIWNSTFNYYNPKDLSQKKEYPANGTVLQVISGVLYLPSSDQQRLAVRGRGRLAVYLSFDKGKTWELAIDVVNNVTGGTDWKGFYNFSAENLAKCEKLVYFKEVLQVTNNTCFIGLGLAIGSENSQEGVDEPELVWTANNYLNAYGSEAAIKSMKESFESEYFFRRTYNYVHNEIKYYDENNLQNISVLEFNGHSNYPANNIIDKNLGTVGLSNEVLTNGKTFDVVIDLGENIWAHTLNIYSWIWGGKNQAPADFKVYLGKTRETMAEIAVVENGKIGDKTVLSNTTSTITFDRQEVRYLRIVVTRSMANHYAAIAGIKFTDGYIYNGIQVAPNSDMVKFTGNNWKSENEVCTFGHIYKGKAEDFVEFKFTGNRVGFFAYRSADYGTVDLYLDGKLIASNVDLSVADNKSVAAYVSEELTSGNHIFAIVGKTGDFNVDSFLYWK